MKKSIKYAGIAAATLLAVAPVAAPVLSSTTNVNAAVVNGKTSDAEALSASIDKFNGKFGGSREASVALKNDNMKNVALNESGKTYAQFITSSTAKWLADNSAANDATVDDTISNGSGDQFTADDILKQTGKQGEKGVAAANVRDIVVTAQETLADGSTVDVDSNANLQQGLSDVDGVKSVSVKTSYTYDDTEGVKQTGSTTLVLKNTVNALSQVNVNYTTPFNVALNQTVTSSKLLSGTDLKITDQNGKALLSSNAVPSDNFFDSARGAVKNMASATVDGDVVTTDKYRTNGVTYNKTATFKKAGTWYQSLTVTFPAKGALSNYLALAMTNSQDNALVINGTKFGAIDTDTFDFGKDADGNITSMKFARAINVSDDSSQWTVEKTNGVVTTKTGSAYYTLKNGSNKDVKNRALDANTAWKFDQKRTDQNGDVQYRVATNEWIDASNVTVGNNTSDNNNNENNGSGLTDVQSVKGVVSVGTPGFTYLLYSKDGKQIKNRALAGGTDWAFINTAKDSDGTTYYRVATNEWVAAGNGVTVK